MPSSNTCIQEFLYSVCREVRFKSIHKTINKELSDHIEDQKNEYLKQGFDEEVAIFKAVEQMGDPSMVGKQLNNTHRPKIEWSVLSITLLLLAIGSLVQYFLSLVNEDSKNMFSHFLLYAPIGLLVFVIMYFLDYTLLGRFSKLAYFLLLGIGLLGCVRLGNPRIYVIYWVLLIIPIFAGVIYGFRNKGYLGIIFSGLFYTGAAFTCILASSFTALILLTVSCLIIMTLAILKGFFSGNKKVSLAIVYLSLTLSLLLTIFTYAISSSYRFERIISIFNPTLNPSTNGWLTLMVRKLLYAANPLGTAILDTKTGNVSIERLLPMWSNDLSLTYIIARLGYIPGIVIIGVMLIFIIRMFTSVLKQKNAYGFLVSFSCCLVITGQIVFFILSNLGIIAPLAFTLPFISFGAFGFIVNMGLIGLLLSVYRRTDLVNDRLQNIQSNSQLFTMIDGKIIIDLGLKARLIPGKKLIE